jgi:hypothetical protein
MIKPRMKATMPHIEKIAAQPMRPAAVRALPMTLQTVMSQRL